MNARAFDFSPSQEPAHERALVSSLMYEHVRLTDDFDTRGEATFSGNLVGARFSYGLSDQLSVALSGASVVDGKEEAQGLTWRGSSGFVYGLDILDEIFPATEVWPGVKLGVGASAFQVPLNRVESATQVAIIDQRMSGTDLHGNLLVTERWGRFFPYFGIKAFVRSDDWHDDVPPNGAPGSIHGRAHGNVSFVVGAPVALTKELRLDLEAIVVNGTTLSAGLSWSTF